MTTTTTKKEESKVTVQLGNGIDNQYRVLESVQNIARKTQETFPSFPFIKDMIFSYSQYPTRVGQKLPMTFRDDHVFTKESVTTVQIWNDHQVFRSKDLMEILGSYVASFALAQMSPNKRFNKALNYSEHTVEIFKSLGINTTKGIKKLEFTDQLKPLFDKVENDLKILSEIPVSKDFVKRPTTEAKAERVQLHCSLGCQMNEVRISVEKSKIQTALIGLGKCGLCKFSFNTTKVEVENQTKAIKQEQKKPFKLGENHEVSTVEELDEKFSKEVEKIIQETPQQKPKKRSKVSKK